MQNKRVEIHKFLVFAILLAVLMLAWIGVNKWQYGKMPWQMLKEASDRLNQPATTAKNQTVIPSEIAATDARQEIMKDISAKMGDLSPVKPVLGGRWYATRFWFVSSSNSDAYIEYEDGHIMGRILVGIEGAEGKNSYKVIGYFEPGENDWVLKQGRDTMSGKPLDLYEYDNNKKEWVKKN
jgi:hypothetical protein